jgi:acyl-coenzyme A thioesterase PaaI-like protein
MDDKSGEQTIKYDVVPVGVIASMSGLDFVRAILCETIAGAADHADGRAVRLHGRTRRRRDSERAGSPPLQSNRLGAWRLYRDPLGFRDGARGAEYAFKISFVRGMSETSGVVRTEGRVLNAGRRVATAEARMTDAKGRLLAHATTTCLVFEFPKGDAKG